jgi:hypothetical protein
MLPESLPNCSALYDEWSLEPGGTFVSPPPSSQQPEQVLVFAENMKDGSITAAVTPLKGGKSMAGKDKKEVSLVFRLSGPDRFYLAGIGTWDSRFFIGRMEGTDIRMLGSVGRSDSIQYDRPYKVTVRMRGSQITLYENGVLQLSVVDETYLSGQWGLRTRNTEARIQDIQVTKSRPRCFVVMPFASELAFVYDVIERVVVERGFECVRADKKHAAVPVVEDIKADIAQAELVIVDFTGRNPNVYYEAGLADAWKKKWIIIAQSTEDLTFDVRHIRTILYSNRMGADERLRVDLANAITETFGEEARSTWSEDSHSSRGPRS